MNPRWFDSYFFSMVGFGLMVMFICLGLGGCYYLIGHA